MTDPAGTASPTDPGDVRFVDSHCHIHDERIPDGPDGAVAAANAMGVDILVTVGCDRATSEAAIEVASRHDGVFATIGVHPHEATDGTDSVRDLVERHANDPQVVAVGEAGLDYYYDHSPRATQRTVFAEHIGLANDHALPLVIHTRDAWDDTFEILDAEGTPERTIFHCFTGGPDEAQRALERGAFLSFSGIVTFRSATDVQAAAARCPLERLLIETDSPYLAPVPHRGKPNRPAWVPHVAEFLAGQRGRSIADIAATTRAAADDAFGGRLLTTRGA